MTLTLTMTLTINYKGLTQISQISQILKKTGKTPVGMSNANVDVIIGDLLVGVRLRASSYATIKNITCAETMFRHLDLPSEKNTASLKNRSSRV